MRQGTNGRRPRGRPHRKQHGGGQPRHGTYDSSGPEGRVRGNAHQVYEKYIGMARDALSAGDRITAETYYQYAEHYYRIVNARTDPKPGSEGQVARRGGNGQGEAPIPGTEEQPLPEPVNGEPPEAASQAPETQEAQERPARQPRRRGRQAQPAEAQPEVKPDIQSDLQPSEDGEPAEA